jgi:hypothetical protein
MELFRRDDTVDETERQGAMRVKAFAEQGQLTRQLEPDDPRQQRRHAAIGAGAEMNIAAGEDRILGGDREIGGEDEAETEPGRSPLHRGDDRLWHMPQPNQKRVQCIDGLIERSSSVGRRESDQLTEHADVAAGAEMGTGAA